MLFTKIGAIIDGNAYKQFVEFISGNFDMEERENSGMREVFDAQTDTLTLIQVT